MTPEEWHVAKHMVETGWVWHLWIFIFGAMWGSYCNVCIYRIPLGKTTVKPRSFCFSCKTDIPPYHNIPIFSYLFLRGKCSNCQQGYSPRYMLIEVLTGLLFWLVWVKFGCQWVTPVYWVMIFGLVMGTFIDFDWRILPDRITIGGIFIGLILSPFVPGLHEPFVPFAIPVYVFLAAVLLYGLRWEHKQALAWEAEEEEEDEDDDLVEPELSPELDKHLIDEKQVMEIHHVHAVIVLLIGLALCIFYPRMAGYELQWNGLISSISGAALGFVVLWVVSMVGKAIYKRDAMGFGDVKLLSALGAFFGWKSVFFLILVSSMLGTIVGVALICMNKKEMTSAIPFGPYIAGAGICWIFFGPESIDWYWSTLGPGAK